jgi:hypothetical protein
VPQGQGLYRAQRRYAIALSQGRSVQWADFNIADPQLQYHGMDEGMVKNDPAALERMFDAGRRLAQSVSS